MIRLLVANMTNRMMNALRLQPVFHTYIDALDACKSAAYQDQNIVQVVVQKTKIFSQDLQISRNLEMSALRTLIGLAPLPKFKSLRVIDFGGAAGFHYFLVKAAVGEEVDIRWNVVETSAMSRAASKVLSSPQLNFFENIEDALADLGQVDLAFSSGAFQCTPDPLDSLRRFLNVNAKYVYITRTALNHYDENFISIQKSMLSHNGPGPLPKGFTDSIVSYPVSFVSKKKFEQEINKFYSIRFSINEESKAYKVNNKNFSMYGYFGDLKNS